MLKYALPALLLFSSAAIADERNLEDLVGLYEFDLKGSELSINEFRTHSFWINGLRITGLSSLDPEDQARLTFYGLIDGGNIIEDSEAVDEGLWKLVSDIIAGSMDDQDRTSMIIDRNLRFSYANAGGSGYSRATMCEVIALSEHDGVVCERGKGIMRVVASDDDRTRIDIKIDGKPAQRYVKID